MAGGMSWKCEFAFVGMKVSSPFIKGFLSTYLFWIYTDEPECGRVLRELAVQGESRLVNR